MDQPPYIATLEEGIDLLYLTQLDLLFKYYRSTQEELLNVDLRGLWNKLDNPKYPFCGVMTMQDMMEATMFSDILEEDIHGNTTFAQINEIKTCVILQTQEVRELQRLASFIKVNLLWGRHPLTQERYSDIFQANGIVLTGRIETSEIERVGFETVIQRTDKAQSKDMMHRADQETLWQTQLDIHGQVQTAVTVAGNQPVITALDFQFTLAYNPS